MIYSQEVEEMCKVAQGVHHGLLQFRLILQKLLLNALE